jgi:hypothetical protein
VILPTAYVLVRVPALKQAMLPEIPPTRVDEGAEISADEKAFEVTPLENPCKPPSPALNPPTAPLAEMEPAEKDCVTVPPFTNPASPPTFTSPDPVETIVALEELPVIDPLPRVPTMPPTFAAPVIDPPDTWTFVYVKTPLSPLDAARPPVNPLVFVDVTEGLTRVRFLM